MDDIGHKESDMDATPAPEIPVPKGTPMREVGSMQGTQVRRRLSAFEIAEKFHETYERLAPSFGYRTREASAKPWDEVPEQNKALMVAVVASLINDRVIR